MDLKKGDLVKFKSGRIKGVWEVVKVYKNGDVNLAVPDTDEELGIPIESDLLELAE